MIETKRLKFSVEAEIPQALANMLGLAESDRPMFELVTNGFDFIFLKAVRHPIPEHSLSYPFSVRRQGDLQTVAAILKQLAAAAKLP